ncbi:MAG: type II CRISPR-associated endonuclease Cas1, partial [Terriglobia bacterium]
MIDRIIEIANPARLSVRDAQLVIERPQAEQLSLPFTTPISEIAVLLLAHPQVTLSQAVLSRIAEAGGSVVTIDAKFLPASMQLPVQAHFLQTERFAKQMQLSLPSRKRLWQQIVRAKIRAQGELLQELYGSDAGLVAMSARVRSDDVGNLEAQAARRYWSQVFGDSKFRRGAEGPDQNRHLDYGYTVLRAAVARALCAAGLHPSIGLRHKNRYDAFCLAADVMEPFRPLVDRRVVQW